MVCRLLPLHPGVQFLCQALRPLDVLVNGYPLVGYHRILLLVRKFIRLVNFPAVPIKVCCCSFGWRPVEAD